MNSTSRVRSVLFLQGPHGPFFRNLGTELVHRGCEVIRVNLCGGDWLDWPLHSLNYRGRMSDWSEWIANLMKERAVSDLMVYGDWRPHHREAVHVAKLLGIRVWAFDEGYLRPNWITMERDGVNGNSMLPRTVEAIHKALEHDMVEPGREKASNPLRARQYQAFAYAAMSLFGIPFFPFYRTHRPYSHLYELINGWIPRILTASKRLKESKKQLERIGTTPYFLFPLQLDSDSQVRRYSPFSGMKEAIAFVMTSFAQHAPRNTTLVIRNHPLDNGLIRYDRFIRSFSRACGIEHRVIFVESGNGLEMIRRSKAVVLLNSTMGLQALEQGKSVYCVGSAVYGVSGLAVCKKEGELDAFWSNPRMPDSNLLADFEKVLRCNTLINGNFYFGRGRSLAVKGSADRLLRESPDNLQQL